MKPIIVIASLKFRAAHVAHLVANYKLAEELGFSPILLVDSAFIRFLPDGLNIETNYKNIGTLDYAVFWFPALANLKVMLWFKLRHKCNLFYVVHEPLEPYSNYIQSGNSHKWTIKFFLKFYISLGFIALADKIILPSPKALILYTTSIANRINSNTSYLPLMFYKESLIKDVDRHYFSYIGTISPDHAYNQYIEFITWAYKQPGILSKIDFQIATRYTVERTPEIKNMIECGRLHIVDGHPLTDNEINTAYASSYCVWNAYHRTTQSGVIAKSFMFGTPALVLRKNIADFMKPNQNVAVCESNADLEEIKDAITYVYKHFDEMSQSATTTYNTIFDYSNHKSIFLSLLGHNAKNHSSNRGGRQPNVSVCTLLEFKTEIPTIHHKGRCILFQRLQCTQRA